MECVRFSEWVWEWYVCECVCVNMCVCVCAWACVWGCVRKGVWVCVPQASTIFGLLLMSCLLLRWLRPIFYFVFCVLCFSLGEYLSVEPKLAALSRSLSLTHTHTHTHSNTLTWAHSFRAFVSFLTRLIPVQWTRTADISTFNTTSMMQRMNEWMRNARSRITGHWTFILKFISSLLVKATHIHCANH